MYLSILRSTVHWDVDLQHNDCEVIMMLFVAVVLGFVATAAAEGIPEDERVRRWHEKNTWPPNWRQDSDSYRAVMDAREAEIMALTGANERWENWMQFVQGRMLPTFTEKGFEVIKTPPHVHAKLKKAVDEALKDFDSIPAERGVRDSIYGPNPPKFVDIGTLAFEVMDDLKELHENWAGGMKLKGTSSYGVRLYRDGASMVMHNDKPNTHVISSIVHIAHEYDSEDEPWPIEIEDHDGNLHAVNLKMGEMLFYESAKCLHGRRSQLKGKYYGSIFVHYQPVNSEIWNYSVADVIANVPPHWNEGLLEDYGSRWAGQAITVDSRVAMGAPPRVEGGNPPPDFSDEDRELPEEYTEEMDRLEEEL